MEPLQVLIPIGAMIGGTILVSLLAASLPESAAWIIGRWLDLWAWRRTNPPEVRERLSDIEGDFWHRYRDERADGSGTTRATLRTMGFVGWELVRAGVTAGTVDPLVGTASGRKKSILLLLAESIVEIYGVRFALGPPTFLLIATPIIAADIWAIASLIHRVLSSSALEYSQAIWGAFACISLTLFAIGLLSKTQFHGLSISQSFSAVPRKRIAAILLVLYYGFWSMMSASALDTFIDLFPAVLSGRNYSLVLAILLAATVCVAREFPLEHSER